MISDPPTYIWNCSPLGCVICFIEFVRSVYSFAVHAILGIGQSKSFTLARTTWKAKPSAEYFPHPRPILLKLRGAYYSSTESPCRLMKVRMPVMVARSSIHGSSMPRLLESSLICSALAFPCHVHGLRIDLKNRQLLPSQDVLLSCLCAGRS